MRQWSFFFLTLKADLHKIMFGGANSFQIIVVLSFFISTKTCMKKPLKVSASLRAREVVCTLMCVFIAK